MKRRDKFDSPQWRFGVHGGGKGGGGGSDTQTVKQEPWAPLQPYITGSLSKAYSLPNQQYYPYSTVAPLSQTTQGVASSLGNFPNYQVPQLDITGRNANAVNELNRTASGDYLYGGPGFNRAVEAAVNKATPGIDSTFAALGRFGGGLHGAELQKTAIDALAGQYGDERRLQQAAAVTLPSVTAQEQQALGYAPAANQQLLANTLGQRAMGGNIYDTYNSAKMQDAVNKWNFTQQEPYNWLSRNASLLGGTGMGTGQTTSPVPNSASSPVAGALGGALAGSQIPGLLVGTGAESALFGAGLPMTAAGLAGWPFALGGAILGGVFG